MKYILLVTLIIKTTYKKWKLNQINQKYNQVKLKK